MRAFLIMVIASLPASAELPRLVPLFDLEASGADRFPYWTTPSVEFMKLVAALDGGSWEAPSNVLVEPFVFWSSDGLLCGPAEDAKGMVDCHDPVRGVPPIRRARPLRPKLPESSLRLGGATLSKTGAIEGGEVKAVAKLRCRRSPLLDRKEYRYLAGPNGRLAVLVLEEDDRRIDCAQLDAECGPPAGPRVWRVLVNIAACPAP